MKKLLGAASVVGLVLTIVPSMFVFAGKLPWRTHTQLMFAGMVLWFLCAPFWMKRTSVEDAA